MHFLSVEKGLSGEWCNWTHSQEADRFASSKNIAPEGVDKILEFRKV